MDNAISTVPIPATSRFVITGEDTVTITGERGRWVVESLRLPNPNAQRAADREPAVQLTRVTRQGRAIEVISIWVHPTRMTLVRKSNPLAEELAAVYDLPKTKLTHGVACYMDGVAMPRIHKVIHEA